MPPHNKDRDKWVIKQIRKSKNNTDSIRSYKPKNLIYNKKIIKMIYKKMLHTYSLFNNFAKS